MLSRREWRMELSQRHAEHHQKEELFPCFSDTFML
jgi:hypothetical protein